MAISHNGMHNGIEEKRKSHFRARNKIDEVGAISHITQQSSGADPLFQYQHDYNKMIDIIRTVSRDFSLDILLHHLYT